MLDRRTLLKACMGAAIPSLPAWAQDGAGFGVPPIPSPGFRRKKLGDIEVIALSDGVSRRPLTEQFVTNAALAEVRALLAAQGLPTDYIDVGYTPFVLVFGGRKLLFDAGLGEYGGPTAGKLLAHLQAAGLQAGDIDTVLVSHFHGDHVQGLRNKAGHLVFPKARMFVPAPEYAYWMDDDKARAATDARSKGLFANARRVFGGMPETMLQRFEPGAELLPGLRSLPAYGHTPGHTIFEAGSGAQSFLYLADLTNVPALFVRKPDWTVGFDMDAAAARRVRREVLARLAGSRRTVGGFHFPFPAFGHIETEGDGYAFKPLA